MPIPLKDFENPPTKPAAVEVTANARWIKNILVQCPQYKTGGQARFETIPIKESGDGSGAEFINQVEPIVLDRFFEALPYLPEVGAAMAAILKGSAEAEAFLAANPFWNSHGTLGVDEPEPL